MFLDINIVKGGGRVAADAILQIYKLGFVCVYFVMLLSSEIEKKLSNLIFEITKNNKLPFARWQNVMFVKQTLK